MKSTSKKDRFVIGTPLRRFYSVEVVAIGDGPATLIVFDSIKDLVLEKAGKLAHLSDDVVIDANENFNCKRVGRFRQFAGKVSSAICYLSEGQSDREELSLSFPALGVNTGRLSSVLSRPQRAQQWRLSAPAAMADIQKIIGESELGTVYISLVAIPDDSAYKVRSFGDLSFDEISGLGSSTQRSVLTVGGANYPLAVMLVEVLTGKTPLLLRHNSDSNLGNVQGFFRTAAKQGYDFPHPDSPGSEPDRIQQSATQSEAGAPPRG